MSSTPRRSNGERSPRGDPTSDKYPRFVVPDRIAPVLADVRPLAERFRDAGHEIYLVGGIVRDLLLSRPLAGDYDFTTDALPEETKRAVREDVRRDVGDTGGPIQIEVEFRFASGQK